ncbi:MAG TPA: hypothetical protein VJ875_25980 [Pyrinomonadaceae bacterium]|nr:hypothetical protein [Pyrinomonadaceae bacterium]
MALHRIQLLTIAVVLSTLFLASGVTQSTDRQATARNAAPAKTSAAAPTATWTFEGCWTQFQSGPCRDVFRDAQGNYWICRDCGTTGNPTPGKCSPISEAALARGFWCS